MPPSAPVNAHCAITTDNAYEPVVIEGEAALIDDPGAIGAFVTELNRKYKTDYSIEFFNPTANAFKFGRPGPSASPRPTSAARPPAGRLRREVIQENLSTTYPEGGPRDRTAGIGEPGNP